MFQKTNQAERPKMETKKVEVLPYDAKWRLDFEDIKREILAAIGLSPASSTWAALPWRGCLPSPALTLM